MWAGSPHSIVLDCTHAVFEQVPVDRLLARRGSSQRLWTGLPTESDSLAQGRIGLCRPFSKGLEDSPMWTSGKRVCAIRAVLWTDCRTGSRARGRAAYTPNVPRLHTNSFSKPAPVDRQLARRGSNQRLWTGGSFRRATHSLRDARGHLTHVRGATWQTVRLERERKARDLVLATHREGYL